MEHTAGSSTTMSAPGRPTTCRAATSPPYGRASIARRSSCTVRRANRATRPRMVARSRFATPTTVAWRNGSVVGVDKAGHWLHHDRLEEFLRTVREFLGQEGTASL